MKIVLQHCERARRVYNGAVFEAKKEIPVYMKVTPETGVQKNLTVDAGEISSPTIPATIPLETGKVSLPTVPSSLTLAFYGFVFSGIGTNADFEVGAITYLYENTLSPTTAAFNPPPNSPVFCGTFMGAINAAKLAEGTATSLTELQNFWLGLKQIGDLYVQQKWLFNSPAWIQEAMSGALSDVLVPVTEASTATFTALENGLSIVGAVAGLATGVSAMSTVAGLVSKVISLFAPNNANLTDLANLYNNLISNPSLYDATPLQNLISSQINSKNIMSSGFKLRNGAVNLDDGQLYYFDEKFNSLTDIALTGQITPSTGSTPLVMQFPQAILACASFPMLFAPVNDNNMDLVDGSIRQSVPLAPAIAAGANFIYVFVPSPLGIAQSAGGTYAPSNSASCNGILGTLARASDGIMSNVIQLSSIVPQPAHTTIIQPTFNVHGAFAVDPGLISIAMAYGYMRAAEIANYDGFASPQTDFSALRSLSDQIIALRVEIWGLENQANASEEFHWQQANTTNPNPNPPGGAGASNPPPIVPLDNASVVSNIRNLKLQLRGLLCSYTQSPLFKIGFLPSTDFRSASEISTIAAMSAPFNNTDYRAWYMQWERHQYTPQTATPYAQFIDGSGNVNANLPAASSTNTTPMANDLCTAVPPFPTLNVPT